MLVFDKLGRIEVEQAEAGDIVAVVGLGAVDIGDTIADPETARRPAANRGRRADALSMLFTVNDSPLTGEGQYLTSRHLKERLDRELQSNVALRVEPTEERDSFMVSGRGLLHLSVLIETMRREGYELAVGKPEVIIKQINGVTTNRSSSWWSTCPTRQIGPVMELVGGRRGEMAKMDVKGAYAHLEFVIPARGLIGLRNRLMSAHAGRGDHAPQLPRVPASKGDIPRRRNGVMVSMVRGQVGRLRPGQPPAARHDVRRARRRGLRGHDRRRERPQRGHVVNPCKEKKLTNMRASGSDKNILLKPPAQLTLEIALEYIEADELVEITPSKIRLRKKDLSVEGRKRSERSGKKVSV